LFRYVTRRNWTNTRKWFFDTNKYTSSWPQYIESKREREIGPKIEEVARKSCSDALEKEKLAWGSCDENGIGASYDMHGLAKKRQSS